jgi:hypothetical protein
MLLRAILLLAVFAFLSADIGRADDSPNLPSHKASVVLPLLKKIKPGDDISKVQQILGNNFDPDEGGAGQMQWYCTLEDGSVVHVATWDMPSRHGIASIDVIGAPKKALSSTPGAAR